MKIILHVGMPKCGSSAIQAMLSSKEFYDLNKSKVLYVSILDDGSLIHGMKLVNRATNLSTKYVASTSSTNLENFSIETKKKIQEEIISLGEIYETIILSREEWGQIPVKIEKAFNILDHPHFTVNIITYIRPQVQWINSAWWQWGAWIGIDFDKWLNNSLEKINWAKILGLYNEIKWVNEVNVRLMTIDVTQDFCSLLNFVHVKLPKTNQSLPGSVLRFFQHYRQLRPGPHASRIEFILGSHIDFSSGKTPWILNKEKIIKLLNYYRDENSSLKNYLDKDSFIDFQNNSYWHSYEPYKSLIVESPNKIEIQKSELEELLFKSFTAIVKLNKNKK